MVASAASPVIAANLRAVAAGLSAEASGATGVTVQDVVPLPADDPRGAGLAAAGLPMVMGGLAGAGLFTTLVRGRARRLAGALAYAVTGGLTVSAVLHFWLGSLTGNWWAEAGAVAVAIGSITVAVLGLESLLGLAGLGVGAVVMMLLGNPLAGGSTAPEMLPGWSGALGQLLPPGAGTSLLRSVSYFDGAGTGPHLLVLAVWLLVGVALIGLSSLWRTRRSTAAPTTAPAERELAPGGA